MDADWTRAADELAARGHHKVAELMRRGVIRSVRLADGRELASPIAAPTESDIEVMRTLGEVRHG